MYSSYVNYFDADSFNIQEMVECDIREMDFNFNDPLLQGEHILSPQDSHRLAKQDRYREHPTATPADLTNLQWLQNVSIPMEKGSKTQESEMMVDPNTAMPVQWTNNSHQMNQISSVTARSVPITPVTSAIPPAQPVQHARVTDSKTKLQESKSASKENTKPGEKAYPKPLFSYSCLIAMALKNSESGTLPVSEIYKFMMGKFPYFKTAPDGWKNSVRHNLSLNKAFCKLERPQGASQRKGCLWSLKPEKKEQMDKEIRKWKKKHSEAIRASMAHPEDLNVSSDDLDDSPPQHLFVHHTELVDDKAAADAAKELFGNNLIQEIQNEDLDWDEIMASSTDIQLDPTLTTTMTTTTMPIHNGTTTTTEEIDNAAHYYNGERHEYETTSSYAPHYYTMQQHHMSVQGF